MPFTFVSESFNCLHLPACPSAWLLASCPCVCARLTDNVRRYIHTCKDVAMKACPIFGQFNDTPTTDARDRKKKQRPFNFSTSQSSGFASSVQPGFLHDRRGSAESRCADCLTYQKCGPTTARNFCRRTSWVLPKLQDFPGKSQESNICFHS